MVTRRGFIGLVAGALGAAALPTLEWFDAAPQAAALALGAPPILLRHFAAMVGAEGGHVEVFIGAEPLISLAVAPLSRCDWFGCIVIGPEEKLRVEIKGDVTWSAVANDGRIFKWNGKELLKPC